MSRIRIDDIKETKPVTDEDLQRVTGGGIVIQERSSLKTATLAGDYHSVGFFSSADYTVWKSNR